MYCKWVTVILLVLCKETYNITVYLINFKERLGALFLFDFFIRHDIYPSQFNTLLYCSDRIRLFVVSLIKLWLLLIKLCTLSKIRGFYPKFQKSFFFLKYNSHICFVINIECQNKRYLNFISPSFNYISPNL